LEGIREKILILYQTVDQCEQECKNGCESNYIRNRLNRKEGGAPETFEKIFSEKKGLTDKENTGSVETPGIFDKMRTMFKKNNDSTDAEENTVSTHNSSDKTPGFFERIRKNSTSSDTSLTDHESTSDYGSVGSRNDNNSKAEEFCDNHSKRFKDVYTQICSMPDRISSESTQRICKLAINLRTEIDELFKLYKADIASDAEKIAEQKADFFGRKAGGSKKTQKRRQYAKKR
jgi:hypothetical protein